jgi:arsenite-transporting ATPase
VITRFLKWFQDFGIPVGGIVVNGLLPVSADHQPEFIANRRAMQAEHLETIWRLFDGQVRPLVPLFDTEVRGIETLNRLAAARFG